MIDLQEGFVAEGARMWTPQNLRILPGVKQLIERCRALSVPIIFTEHVHDASGRDRGLMWDVPLNRPIKDGALRIGAKDSGTYHQVAPLPNEKVIQKHRYSAFFDTDCDFVNPMGAHLEHADFGNFLSRPEYTVLIVLTVLIVFIGHKSCGFRLRPTSQRTLPTRITNFV